MPVEQALSLSLSSLAVSLSLRPRTLPRTLLCCKAPSKQPISPPPPYCMRPIKQLSLTPQPPPRKINTKRTAVLLQQSTPMLLALSINNHGRQVISKSRDNLYGAAAASSSSAASSATQIRVAQSPLERSMLYARLLVNLEPRGRLKETRREAGGRAGEKKRR